MNDDVVTALLNRFTAAERRQVVYRQGVVTTAAPLAVALGGSTVPYSGVSALGSYAPTVGDIVSVLTFGNDLIVLGKRASATASGVGVFSAYRSTAQTVPTATIATILFDSEERDVSGWYDVATGKYQPLLAGYYRLNVAVMVNQTTAAGTRFVMSVFKTGGLHKHLNIAYSAGGDADQLTGSCQVQANGTTDYFTVGFQHTLAGNLVLNSGSNVVYFQGELIRP